MSHDKKMKKEDIKDIIKYSGILMKIQVYLNKDITINSFNIKKIIQTEVFGYLQKGFEKAFEKIEKQIQILNFLDA